MSVRPPARGRWRDRAEAGTALAAALAELAPRAPVVLALPRGGVPVAGEIARRLGAPLDLVMVRKIGAPRHRELALAAVVDGGAAEIVVNDAVARAAGIDRSGIDALAVPELEEIARRRALYPAGDAPEHLSGHTAIVVDDGIATGATMRAALRGVRRRNPDRLVLAVGVAPQDVLAELRAEADEIVCPLQPDDFRAVGAWYDDFGQVDDATVVRILADRAPPARP